MYNQIGTQTYYGSDAVVLVILVIHSIYTTVVLDAANKMCDSTYITCPCTCTCITQIAQQWKKPVCKYDPTYMQATQEPRSVLSQLQQYLTPGLQIQIFLSNHYLLPCHSSYYALPYICTSLYRFYMRAHSMF